MKFHVLPSDLAVEGDTGVEIELSYTNANGNVSKLTSGHKRLLRFFLLSAPDDLYGSVSGVVRGKTIYETEVVAVLGSAKERNRATSFISQCLAAHRRPGGGDRVLELTPSEGPGSQAHYRFLFERPSDTIDWLDCQQAVARGERLVGSEDWRGARSQAQDWHRAVLSSDLDSAFSGISDLVWTDADRGQVETVRRRLDRIIAISVAHLATEDTWHQTVMTLVDRFFDDDGELEWPDRYDGQLAEAAVRAQFAATVDLSATVAAIDKYFIGGEIGHTPEITTFLADENDSNLSAETRRDKWQDRWLNSTRMSSIVDNPRGADHLSAATSDDLSNALGRVHRRLANIAIAPTGPGAPHALPIWTFHVPLRSDLDLSGHVREDGRLHDVAVFRRDIAEEHGLVASDGTTDRAEPVLGPLEADALSQALEPRLRHLAAYVRTFEETAIAGRLDESGFVYIEPAPIVLAPPWQPGPKYPATNLDLYSAVGLFSRCVVIGGPGSGKSTFLRYLSIWHASRALRTVADNLPSLPTWEGELRVPFYVELRSFVASDVFPTELSVLPTVDELFAFIASTLGIDGEAQAEVERLFEDGEAILLLDGLDEVPIPPDDDDGNDRDRRRDQLRGVIDSTTSMFPKLRVILTSRTAAYPKWAISGFTEINIAPLDQHVGRSLTKRLFLATGRTEPEAQRLANGLTDQLWQSHSALRDQPLFLSLVASIFARRGGALPTSRSELLEESTLRLLEKWTDPRYGGTPLPEMLGCEESELLDALAAIALAFMDSDQDDAHTRLGMILTGFFKIRRSMNPTAVLEFVTERAGLLVSLDEDDYRFIHRQIEEYLAARSLRSSSPDLGKALIKRLTRDVDKWRVTTALALEATIGDESPAELCEVVLSTLDGLDGHPDALAHIAYCYAHLRAGARASALTRTVDETVRQRVTLDILDNDASGAPLAVRVTAVEAIAALGDARPGTRLDPSGLPDISWCEIPQGTYRLGLTSQDIGLIATDSQIGEWDFSRERPHHPVEVDRYLISRYPITGSHYQAFVKASDGYFNDSWWEFDGRCPIPPSPPPAAEIDTLPQVQVSWFEAVAFCRWLSARLQATVRLPTEAEWEIAARGPRGRLFPWGPRPDTNQVNILEAGVGRLVPVGTSAAESAWSEGPLDMIGNCWEWCSSCPGPASSEFKYPYVRDDGREELSGAALDAMRVTRGGYFGFRAWFARSTYRGRDHATLRAPRQGFRVVREAE